MKYGFHCDREVVEPVAHTGGTSEGDNDSFVVVIQCNEAGRVTPSDTSNRLVGNLGLGIEQETRTSQTLPLFPS